MLLRLTFPVSLADVAKIESAREKAAGGYYEHWADQQHELHMYYPDQERASHEEGTTPTTVRKYLPAALQRSKSGKWIATKSDRYVRLLSLPGPHGPVTVRAHGSKEAQFASAYLASLSRWSHTEKPYELAPFHGKKIGNFELITAVTNPEGSG